MPFHALFAPLKPSQGRTERLFLSSLDPLRQNDDRKTTTVQLLTKKRSIFLAISAISCAYYCRIPYALFFQNDESESGAKIFLSFATRASLAMFAFLVVMIGIAPNSLVLAAQEAATALLIW